jgi:hypothetical protein
LAWRAHRAIYPRLSAPSEDLATRRAKDRAELAIVDSKPAPLGQEVRVPIPDAVRAQVATLAGPEEPPRKVAKKPRVP